MRVQRVRERVEVGVRVDDGLGSRQPAAVDDRGVVELVREHDPARRRERGDHARVGQEARAEQHACLGALERRELLLDARVQRHVPRHQARRPRARAPLLGGVRGGGAESRVAGQPEVVVGAQQQHLAAVEPDLRPLRALDHAQLAEQPGGAQLLEDGVDVGHVTGPHLTHRAVQPKGST
jgi:hypothetical protein